MSGFFPDHQPLPPEDLWPSRQPDWAGPAEDVVPAVVPLELVIGRSDTTAVLLSGLRAYAAGLQMQLLVRIRPGSGARLDSDADVFDTHHRRSDDPQWQAGRLKWGVEFADGRRVTNVDRPAWDEQPNRDHHRPHRADDWEWEPDHPVLTGQGGSGGRYSADREYWLWPLPPPGRLLVVCQWTAHGIEATTQELDAGLILAAAARSRPLWSYG